MPLSQYLATWHRKCKTNNEACKTLCGPDFFAKV